MILNEMGKVCEQELQCMVNKRNTVDLHEYVIMPNHVHMLLNCRDVGLPRPNSDNTDKYNDNTDKYNDNTDKYNDNTDKYSDNTDKYSDNTDKYNDNTDKASLVPTDNITNQLLGTIIGGRKSAVSKKCHEYGLLFARQSRYHEHIISAIPLNMRK